MFVGKAEFTFRLLLFHVSRYFCVIGKGILQLSFTEIDFVVHSWEGVRGPTPGRATQTRVTS